MILTLKLLAWFFAAVPEGVARCLGRGLGRMGHLFLRSKVKLARDALAASFPDWSVQRVHQTTREVFANQGLFMAEFFRKIGRPKKDPVDEIVFDNADVEHFKRLKVEHGALLVLVGHINNYEYLAAWAARLFPLSIIAKPLKPERFGAYIREVRASYGLQEFPHHDSYRSVLRNLKQGGCVGFILDQSRPRDQGVFVTFFGRPANTSPGLAMMSAHSGVPVLPVWLKREGGRLNVKHLETIPPPPDREMTTLQDYTQRYTTALEQMIRDQPESWIWMHQRWKVQPRPGDRITRADGSAYHA
jgi:Kdo2-lipid IVA lauroyltransferase/acyltransferase